MWRWGNRAGFTTQYAKRPRFFMCHVQSSKCIFFFEEISVNAIPREADWEAWRAIAHHAMAPLWCMSAVQTNGSGAWLNFGPSQRQQTYWLHARTLLHLRTTDSRNSAVKKIGTPSGSSSMQYLFYGDSRLILKKGNLLSSGRHCIRHLKISGIFYPLSPSPILLPRNIDAIIGVARSDANENEKKNRTFLQRTHRRAHLVLPLAHFLNLTGKLHPMHSQTPTDLIYCLTIFGELFPESKVQ